jgi:hypothetical protein
MHGARRTAELGEVLAALFDEAGQLSGDPRVVAWLATRALCDLLVRADDERARRLLAARRFAGYVS